ncbi:stalk domain-containing protein [Thermanaeromonas sp. C210]|uniref:stalk domain-containing protein n=1 Tax=Thermanaeromonas sp. C210 TaxID=2731925 RepID=UPI00155C94E4|nr:stalk domain-containing protein [Thermanaeromonas sp. C210]GFN23416.1 hypothetical protein TAMC210_17330 [Thermanaeromonas sp. C210]
MKRLTVVLLILALTAYFAPGALAHEQQKIPVFVDGLPVAFDVPPVIQNQRVLVPFRAIGEALNIEVSWDYLTRTVRATDGENSVVLPIGSNTAYRNGSPISLEVPPQILKGRTLIPLRFFGEAFGCRVDWDGALKEVRIASPPAAMTVIGFYALGDSRTSSWTNLFGMPYPRHAPGNTDIVDELALGWYSLDKDGNLLTRSRTGWQRPDGWERVLEAAEKYKLKTEMVVHVTDGDGTLSSLLADGKAMERAINEITREGVLYQGVNLDFEGLGYQDTGAELQAVRDAFTGFVAKLAGKLKVAGLNLTLTLHAPNSAYRGYDYQALGGLADRIIIMAYDYGTTPEPVDLVREAVEMARAAVPAEKLVLGISVPAETAASVLTKMGMAKRYGLDGIALWRLGLVPGEIWEALRSTIVPGNRPDLG